MPKTESMDWAQASWALPRRKKVRISNSNGFIGPGFIYSLLWFFQGGFQSCQEVRLVARQPARELPAASQLDHLYEKVIPALAQLQRFCPACRRGLVTDDQPPVKPDLGRVVGRHFHVYDGDIRFQQQVWLNGR